MFGFGSEDDEEDSEEAVEQHDMSPVESMESENDLLFRDVEDAEVVWEGANSTWLALFEDSVVSCTPRWTREVYLEDVCSVTAGSKSRGRYRVALDTANLPAVLWVDTAEEAVEVAERLEEAWDAVKGE